MIRVLALLVILNSFFVVVLAGRWHETGDPGTLVVGLWCGVACLCGLSVLLWPVVKE